MSSDAAAITWYLRNAASDTVKNAVAWPDVALHEVPPDYPQRIPTHQLGALLEQVERYGDATLATRAGRDGGHRPRTPLSLLLRSSRNVDEMSENACRFWNAFSSSTRMERRVQGDRWEMVLVENWKDRPRGLQLFTHYVVGALVGSVDGYTGGTVKPTDVLLPGPARPGDEGLREVLGAPVQHGSDLARVVFPRSALEQTLHTRDELVASYLETELHRAMDRLRLAITWQIDELIRQNLSDGIGMREAAKRLGLSERTLRRRLDEEGTSFRERLDHVRRARALEMLAHHDVQSVAQHLGFVDARSFQRAFRRWTQMTPLEYKRKLRDGAQANQSL
ncbi:MAG TPA: helix-turn-helix domain-containing protein [Sandaracinaceae bacterium LLY-WYZ-13_1]|nr:helix-turn-helix domain-containing protein [Sandaracinaceae bacterium LLY-WYZ-13_1]